MVGSVPLSAVGSSIGSVQRDGGWLFSGCETVMVGNGDATVLEHPAQILQQAPLFGVEEKTHHW